jgi:trehalose 6-phosphate phosphatase
LGPLESGGIRVNEVRRLTHAESSALEQLAEAPRHTGLCCDFDGTIAPIVADPDTSRPLPGALSALHQLSRKLAVVAAVSGRSAAFLADRLELADSPSPLRAIGLHGLEERLPDGTIELRPGVSAWRPVIEAAFGDLVAAVPDGVKVEDKGYGVTVHWRSVEASGAELESIAARTTAVVLKVGAERGLVPRSGKASVELALPLGIDKGTVVTELCGGLQAAAFLGDDSGDVLAFLALDRLRDSSGLRSVKIAVDSDEAPRELIEEADLVLDGPSAASWFLEALAARLGPD